jgi:AcrR family transcriptional regulator
VSDEIRDEWPHLRDWRHLVREHDDTAQEDEGLRERKKRLMRQQISDTATWMFLERGFDDVKVTEIAAACGVSEKTVYNYFPTKESLVLDREDVMASAIQRALGPGASQVPPVEAMVQIMREQLDELISYWEANDLSDMTAIRDFTNLVEETPALRAAQLEMTSRLAQVAAEAMATRAGVDPNDPEPQIAAEALVGLWRIFFAAIVRFSDEEHSPAEVRVDVMAVVRRAARLIDTGLWSFGMTVQGVNGREQLRVAAEASDEVRKQVVIAMKQARDAWRQIKSDIKDQVHEDRDLFRSAKHTSQQQIRQAAQQLKRDAQASKQALQRETREAILARQRVRRPPSAPPRRKP